MSFQSLKNILQSQWYSFMWKALLFLGFAFLLGFFRAYHLPKIKDWLLIEVEKQSQKHSPFRVWPQTVEVKMFPPGVRFSDVRILPQGNLAKNLSPIHLKNFEVSISVLGLIQGSIRASKISIEKPVLNLIFKQSLAELLDAKNENIQNSNSFDLDQIFRLPVDEVELNNVVVQAKFGNDNLAARLLDSNISVENKYKSLLLKADLPEITVKQLGDKPDMTFSLNTKTLVEKTGIQVSSFQLKANNSFAVASGKVQGDVEAFKMKTIDLNSRALFQLNEIYDLIPVFSNKLKIPKLKGSIGIDTKISYDFDKTIINGTYSLESKNVEVQNRLIGNVRSQGNFSKDSVSTPLITVKNRSGFVELKNLTASLGETSNIQGILKVNWLSIRPFLNVIDVGLIPVESRLNGEFPCKGTLRPKIKIDCTGQAISKNLHIYSGDDKSTIVKVPFIQADGTITVTDSLVSYNAKLKAGNKSRGSSKGSISFNKGFNISFIGERLEMSDIEDLVGLKLEGAAALSGTTTGTSKWGTVKIDTRAKQLWLEDYGLGSVDSIILYKDGKLTFRKIKGQFNSSRYEGQLTIDIQKKELFLNQKMPFVDLADVQKIFSRKMKLPIRIDGTGSGQLKAWGPLQFNRMNYNLESSFYRGEVAKETFDKAIFNVTSENGNVKASKVQITKSESTIDLNGTVSPEGKIDAVVVGRQLRLEQSENLSKAGLDIAGQFDSTLLLKGQLPDPEIILNGRLRKLVIGNSPAEDSSFQLNIMKDRLKGNLDFIGKTLKANFIFPYNEKGPFSLNLKTTRWDFTNLFTIFSSTAKKKDFVTQLTSEVKLASPSGGFWNSTGSINVESFLLQRGPLSMTSAGPMFIRFRDGVINSKDLYLKGEGTFLKVDILNARKQALNTDINGKVDLSLVSLLTPFLDDLRGKLSLALKTQGPLNNPSAIGSAFIEDGYVKLDGFPHPFDQINADLLFNQKSLVINAMKASLGGGPIKGEGKIQINSLSHVPVDIRATFEDISLNMPDGMRTKGSGQVQFVGQRFPYLLKGQYNVSYGDITMDFTGSNTKANEIKPSEFLPKFLTEDSFQPIRLDLDINIKKPVAVRNERIDAQAQGKITVKGTPDKLLLNGVINPIAGGIIKFKDTEFEINNGYVDFRNSAPENPIIYLTADAKVTEKTVVARGGSEDSPNYREESTDYEVEMLVQGQAPNIKINLSSQPPLSYQQIVSLLALGMTTATTIDETYNPNQQASRDDALASGVIGTQIGMGLIGRGLSEPLKERLGVELKISTSQSTTDNATYPKVIFSKQWTPKWETSASRTIENNPKSDVKVEYKLNNNISFIGLWEGREQTATDTDQEEEENKVGMDVEYKVNFK